MKTVQERRSCVPAGPIARVIREWELKQDFIAGNVKDGRIAPLHWLASEIPTDVERVRKIRNEQQDWVSFDRADKIVVICVGALAWWIDPELRGIYEGVNLEWLDRTKPCVRLAA